jgi:CRP-like cAMP-binding protein
MFPLHITAESHVYTPQDSCDDIYFVAKGQVALIVGENNSEADGGITMIEQGGWFGLLSLLGSTGTWNEHAMTVGILDTQAKINPEPKTSNANEMMMACICEFTTTYPKLVV